MKQLSTAAEHKTEQRAKLRGRPWVPGQSGNPSGSRVSKRAVALFSAMAADFGGEAMLSAVDRTLLEQAACLLVRSERVKDPDSAVRLSNASARLLASLQKRLERKSEPPVSPLHEYLNSRADP